MSESNPELPEEKVTWFIPKMNDDKDAEIARLSKAYAEHNSIIEWQKLAIENREAENYRLRAALIRIENFALGNNAIQNVCKEALASPPKEEKPI